MNTVFLSSVFNIVLSLSLVHVLSDLVDLHCNVAVRDEIVGFVNFRESALTKHV